MHASLVIRIELGCLDNPMNVGPDALLKPTSLRNNLRPKTMTHPHTYLYVSKNEARRLTRSA